jgi:WD40 repeat protein
MLASASSGTIKLWDAASGELLRTLTGTSYVYSVAFSPDGRMLASASPRSIKLWDAASGELLRTLTGTSYVDSVAFSPDGRILASGYNDASINLWEVAAISEASR